MMAFCQRKTNLYTDLVTEKKIVKYSMVNNLPGVVKDNDFVIMRHRYIKFTQYKIGFRQYNPFHHCLHSTICIVKLNYKVYFSISISLRQINV